MNNEPSHKFITEDDIWGIRKLIRKLIDPTEKYKDMYTKPTYKEKEFHFNIFFNQKIPPAFRESTATVMRHAKEIKELYRTFDISTFWTNRSNGSCDPDDLNGSLRRQIESKKLRLLTYLEIEELKMRWQKAQNYRREEGVSQPIREELIQIRIVKGVNKK